MKKLVVFDLDGTLVDSEEFIVWSFIEAGRAVGVDVDAEAVKKSIGMSLEAVIESAFARNRVSRRVIEEFVRTRRRIVEEYWRARVKLYPDVVPALESLREMGCVLAVASSSVVERVGEFLEYFGVLGYFNAVSGIKPGVRGKPEPDVILVVLEETGFKPEEAVYVGDKEVDCVAARKIGVDFILVDRRPLRETSTCKPVATVSSLLELPLVVKRL